MENESQRTYQYQLPRRQVMAALIGTDREMVGRSLKTLEEEGIIRMERNRIVIADEAALRKMAGIAA